MTGNMPGQDAKSRQSSGGKGILSFMRKDKASSFDDYTPELPRQGLATHSQSSRYSHRSTHERQLSASDGMNGFAANAGVITSIPYESLPDGVAPRTIDFIAQDSVQPLPHHLSKAADFHQYPSFDPSKMGPPQPPPHRSRTSNASTIVGSYNNSVPSYATDPSSFTSNSRTSFDQASVHSTGSGHRQNTHHTNHSQSTISSFGGEQTMAYAPTTPATYRNTQFSFNGQQGYHSPAPEGFELLRPNDERVIEQMFLELMIKRGYKNFPEQARRQMEAYSTAKKWTLIYQDRLAEYQSQQKRKTRQHESGRWGADIGGSILDRAHEEGSPEWYVMKVMDNSITPKELQGLSVSLRSQPIGWVKAFVEAQGQIALTNVLGKINRRQKQGPTPPPGTVHDKDGEREYDIVKCLKALMNNKYGADNAIQHPQIIAALAVSLISPRLATRRLVSDVLTFLCHWGDGLGHQKVLGALDHIKAMLGETGRFDAWMRWVEVAIDGRGKMGSLVGASEEFRSGGIGMENQLMEYAQSSLMLVNTLINFPERDLNMRCGIRAQFISCGIRRILTKMEAFQYDPVDKQIEVFHSNEAIDYEDLLERENGSIKDGSGPQADLTDPMQIVEAIQRKISQTEAYNPFVSSMQHLLLMLQNDSGDSLRAYKLVDAMLNYVAMDRRLPDMELKQALNFTVQSLLDKLYTDSEAQQAIEDAVQAKQVADAAIAERDEVKEQVALGADGLVAKLQKQLDEQQSLLDLRARQVESLKSEIAELQRLRAQELQRNELENRELYLMLKDAQEAAASAAQKSDKNGAPVMDPTQMQGILDRAKLMERLEMQLERAKTRAKLEGKVWQQVSPSDRLRELREKMDGELGDREDDLRKFEASYDSTLFGSSRASRGGPKVQRKAIPSSLPSELVEEQEEDEAIYEKARIVDIARPPKMPANLLAQLNNMKKHESDDSDGITTGTSHPSLETDPQTPADDKPVPVGKTGPPNVDGATLPGFGSNAPPAPPPPGGLPGFGSNVPPPPPMPNGIIPPAPPLPGGKRPGGYLSRKTAPATATPIPLGVARPSKKLKAIHWDKVDDPEVTMWSRGQTLDQREEQYRELSRRGVLDEIERLFLAKEAKKIGMSAKKSDKKSIISSDLSKTWQISLAKFSSTSVEDIVTRILHCDGEIMDNSVVMDFLQRDDLCNIPENVAKLMAPYAKDWTVRNAVAAPRDQDPADLTREDQLYLFTAFELHHYWKARMRALSLTKSYEPDYDEITSRIREIIAVSNALRESVTFLNVLSFILLVGNFMNDPTKQAAGFKISSLTRLSMVKDLTNETTLLDLVERSVRNKWSEWESFADDISGVAVARKINVDMLITDAKKYVSNVKNVQASLDAGNLSDPKKFHPEDRVSLVAQRCMRDARRRAEQLELYLEEMTTTFNDAMTFFGEDPTDENGRRNFFTSFAEFLGEWKKARDKNTGFEETRRRNEASIKRKQQQQQDRRDAAAAAAASFSGTDTPQSPAMSGAMDDLMAKLRAAKPEARDQRDRRRRARLKDRHAVRVASGQEMPELEAMVQDEDEPAAAAAEPGREKSAAGAGPLLSPTSEGSDERSAAGSDGEVDIADRAASLLQDMGGVPDDDDGAEPDDEPEATAARESSLRVRRRREGAAEEERARRRQRRQQARSEASLASVPVIAEEGASARSSAEVVAAQGQHGAGSLATPPPDGGAAAGKRPGTPPAGPVTVVSPPTPEAERKAKTAGE